MEQTVYVPITYWALVAIALCACLCCVAVVAGLLALAYLSGKQKNAQTFIPLGVQHPRAPIPPAALRQQGNAAPMGTTPNPAHRPPNPLMPDSPAHPRTESGEQTPDAQRSRVQLRVGTEIPPVTPE